MSVMTADLILCGFQSGSPAFGQIYLYGEKSKVKEMTDLLYQTAEKDGTAIRKRGSEFTAELIAASIRNGTTGVRDYSESIRQCDTLIFESINDVTGMEFTLETLYFIFDCFIEDKKKIIINGSRPPKDIAGLPCRVRTQLEGCWCINLE